MAITIKNNTDKLQNLKNKVNALPDKEESTPIVLDQTTVSPIDVLVNKTYYSADETGSPVKKTGEMPNLGNISVTVGLDGTGQNTNYGYITGATATFSEEVNNEIDTQTDLIAQIKSVLNNKMAGSSTEPEGTIEITENGSYDVSEYAEAEVNVPIPEGYIIPEGILNISENGTHNVSEYAEVNVSVSGGTSGDDMMQQRVNVNNSCQYLFYHYSGDNVDYIANLDTSNVIYMRYMFQSCSSLTTIPLLDTSNVTDMIGMFQYCNKLTSIPLLDTSSVTGMNSMFSSCSNLTTIPLLDTSKVTNMSGMFNGCTALTEIPLLNTSSVTDMSSMFYNCKVLTTIPLLNTSKATNMGSMFYGCTSLTTIPLLDTSSVTSMNSMFYGCTALTEIPQLDTSSATGMSSMFQNCTSLTTIPALDTSSATSLGYIFYKCSALKSILMTGMKVNFDISASTQFEQSDLVTILNNLATVTTTRTLTMGSTNLAKLTDADVAIATNKGWTLA